MYKASPVLLLFQDHLFVIIKGLSKCGTYSHGTPCIIYQWAMIVFLLYMVNLHKQHVLHESGGPDGSKSSLDLFPVQAPGQNNHRLTPCSAIVCVRPSAFSVLLAHELQKYN